MSLNTQVLDLFSIIKIELFSIKRGFYKSSHVLMNFLYKLNSIILDSINHMTLKLL